MNDPSHQPVEIEEQRSWLLDYRGKTQASWSELAKRLDIPQGTLSQFGSEHGYAGNEVKLAEKVARFRQLLATQAQIEVEAPEVPGYFKTETSQQLEQILGFAQRGRVVVAAMGAGLGKTTTARQFAVCYPNAFIATMAPSTSGVNTMQQEVLEALGEKDATGTPQRLTRRVRDRVKGMAKPLLIIDEAQHLSEKSIEEIRGWHDAIGVGIALLGNESVLQRLEGGSRRAAFAQLYSRVSMRVIRTQPLRGDIDALAAAWRIGDERVIDYLRKIAMLPGALRNATFALELAVMIASSEGEPLGTGHLQDAWAQLSSRPVLQ